MGASWSAEKDGGHLEVPLANAVDFPRTQRSGSNVIIPVRFSYAFRIGGSESVRMVNPQHLEPVLMDQINAMLLMDVSQMYGVDGDQARAIVEGEYKLRVHTNVHTQPLFYCDVDVHFGAIDHQQLNEVVRTIDNVAQTFEYDPVFMGIRRID